MIRANVLAAALAMALIPLKANDVKPITPLVKASDGQQRVAGIMWRCRGGGWGWPGKPCKKKKKLTTG